MGLLILRICAAVLAALLGGLAGLWLGSAVHAPIPGLLTGSALAVAVVGVLDAVRGHRLLRWLRGPHEVDPPRATGFWGEIGYRVETLIRRGEQSTALERTRLAQLRSAIEVSPNGVLMIDAEDQIDWLNSVAADHFALDPKRDIRQRVTNLVRAPEFVAFLQAQQWDAPARVPSPRGKGVLSVLIRRYGEGQKLILSSDITEVERTDSMRRDFVANVSHEIRTPLTVVAGFVETLMNLPLTEVERRGVLALMAQQTARMQSLVSDLLTLAVLEGSPRPAVDQWVAISRLFAQVEVDARALSGGRHRLAFDVDEAVQIAGSESEMLSAVSNLVNNAVRYTPDEGRIAVTWRLLPDGSGEVAVADTGIGIEREHLPRLTERFYRADSSRSRETGGTGLGLSIVKHVVQRHGGRLDIASEPGKGSTFRLVFPAARIRCLEPAPDPRRSKVPNH